MATLANFCMPVIASTLLGYGTSSWSVGIGAYVALTFIDMRIGQEGRM